MRGKQLLNSSMDIFKSKFLSNKNVLVVIVLYIANSTQFQKVLAFKDTQPPSSFSSSFTLEDIATYPLPTNFALFYFNFTQGLNKVVYN